MATNQLHSQPKEPIETSYDSEIQVSTIHHTVLYDECSSGPQDPHYQPLVFRDHLNILADGLLDMRGMRMKHYMPSTSDSQLKSVTRALLDFNSFRELPPCILEMTNLQFLSISCQTNLGRASRDKQPALKALPENIGWLIHLQNLYAGANAISSLPASVSYLKCLQDVDLRLNQFKSFPDVLLQLRGLKRLVLSGNYLKELPATIQCLNKLEELHLGNNLIEELPDEICSLRKLRTLVLRNNKLIQLPPRLYKLGELRGTHKRTLPRRPGDDQEDDDADDDEDQGLHLEGNPLTFPPVDVCMSGTESLFAYMANSHQGCKETTLIFKKHGIHDMRDIIIQNPAVEFLDVRRNKITHLPDEIRNLQRLHTLLLDKNQMEEFPVKQLSQLPHLRVVSLNSQRQEDAGTYSTTMQDLPEDIYLCKSIQELYLENNLLVTLPKSVGCLKALRILELSSNKLKELPDELFSLENLECLSLSNNYLKAIPKQIGRLKHLKVLRVSKNELTSIPDSVCTLKKLMTLSLRKNHLRFLPPDITKLKCLTKTNGHVEYHAHDMTYRNELKVEDNKEMKIPPSDVCMKGVEAIFAFFDTMKRENPGYLYEQIDLLRERPQRLPSTIASTEYSMLDDGCLAKMSLKIGDEYHQLGPILGVRNATMQHIASAHQGRMATQIQNMLLQWRNATGGSSPTSETEMVKQLCEALKEVKRTDLVEEFFSMAL